VTGHARASRSVVRGHVVVALLLGLVCGAPAWAKRYAGPGGALTLESREINGAEYVPLCDAAEALGLTMAWYFEARVVALRNQKITLELLANSSCVLVDKRDTLRMERALTFWQGEPLVPATLLTRTLQPYAARFGARKESGSTRVVVIDAGHGGGDPGALGYGGYREKDLTLDIARRVRAGLTERGIKVRMTRDGDTTVSLDQRAAIANDIGAAALVSIHANTVKKDTRTITGSETFYLAKAQTASASATERLENSPAKNNVNSMWSSLTARLKRFFLGRHYQSTREKSISLARRVQTRVGAVAIGDNRGIKPANLSVLRNTFCPACLVEVGFISNPTDVAYLKKPWYRQKIAEAIVTGIAEYLATQ
jgi:N-acetylmuramoyl-L-alanine amidase